MIRNVSLPKICFQFARSTFLRGIAAAAGIAFACSIANLGGFASTYFLGWRRDLTHSMIPGLIMFGSA
jgi:hypothetical protein